MRLSSRDEGVLYISLTPLVDVVFILLVFFMLASSFVEWRSIDAHTQAAQGRSNGLEGSVLADLKANGDVVIAGKAMPVDLALSYLADIKADRPDIRLILRPEQGVALQNAVNFAEDVKRRGIEDVTFKPVAGAE